MSAGIRVPLTQLIFIYILGFNRYFRNDITFFGDFPMALGSQFGLKPIY